MFRSNSLHKAAAIIVFCCILSGCDYFTQTKNANSKSLSESLHTISVKTPVDSSIKNSVKPLSAIGEIEQHIIDAGLINMQTIDSSIVVDLKYSTNDNFLGIDVYGDFDKCYLQKDVAEKLKMASFYLRSKFPYYKLIVFDAVRPRSIQVKMWDTINIPLKIRSQYLANPANGSLHSYGAAVDISIIDDKGNLLDMGTKYDYFGELAYPRKEEILKKEGKLNYTQLFNRKLLREVMEKSGFFVATTEWWHFNSCNRVEANAMYKIIE
jgi:D-alanyl-D-alanine dipeptidase